MNHNCHALNFHLAYTHGMSTFRWLEQMYKVMKKRKRDKHCIWNISMSIWSVDIVKNDYGDGRGYFECMM